MSSALEECPACNCSFTRGGLLHHYRRTPKQRCIEVYGQTVDYVPDLDREPSPMLQDLDEEDALEFPDDISEMLPNLFAGAAGALLPKTELPSYTQYQTHLSEMDHNLWAPFKSQIDWQITCWAKVRGSTSTAFTDLLAIEGVTEALGLSYKNSGELNKIIDEDLLSGQPVFKRQEIVVGREVFNVFFWPIMECVPMLYGDPEFAQDLIFSPERHYTNPDKTIRLYHDIHTVEWWWKTQKKLEKRQPGATVVSVIISTDKTQTTMFRNKAAYPVYMTISNIPKDICRKPLRQAYILIGYLPTTHLDHITVTAARQRALANLYHACIEMASGDGVVRCCHPILAIFAGNYPEQALVAGIKVGDCPTCPIPRDKLGDFEEMYEPRDLTAVLEALAKSEGDTGEFTRACNDAGIKPIYRPFWDDLPFVNIFLFITPDVLHQLYQGVSGTEHSQICCILLGLIVDLQLPERQSTACLIRAVRGALDFLYYAQYPMQSSETLGDLQDDLQRFHDNKSIFVDLGIWNNFNIPKLHNMSRLALSCNSLHNISHYLFHLRLFGTMDNYNTEYTKHLHIDFTKDAYRTTNRKDEYLQMMLWLERKEKVLQHDKFIRWCCAGSPPPTTRNSEWRPANFVQHRHLQMTKFPSVYGVKMGTLTTAYGAEYFCDAFARFIVGFKNLALSKRQVEMAAADFSLPFQSVSVYHKIKFWNEDPLGHEDTRDTLDVVHVKPGYVNKQGRLIGGRFDTVIINDGTGQHSGVKGYHVRQVRVVFSLTNRVLDSIFPVEKPPQHLAYVEWFSAFPSWLEPNHRMYKISQPIERVASIIPVANIRRSVHLFPQFGPVAPREWTSQNVLELCTKFYVSPWSDQHAYITIC
ncbi:hypothetical protein FB451DRAFT_1337209 [Mycena latifolia]|nr:hypothetical protein FB451DRAFT_1337209 [Mycena latifolia]